MALAQKGRHGYDGGDHFRSIIYLDPGFRRSHLRKTDVAKRMGAAMGGVGYLKVLRAFHYMKIMDMWGNVPIALEVSQSPSNLKTKPRKEVFDFIKKELEENVPKLPLTSGQNIGQVSMAAGYAMWPTVSCREMEWYAMWDECIAACDKIISGQAGGIGVFRSFPYVNSIIFEYQQCQSGIFIPVSV
ncbi:hypothetical protein FQR65_LT18455 [Abscondita terminalis]|nr:hypothetical protein FQR65_LT18455 [Abscondita terminalis]